MRNVTFLMAAVLAAACLSGCTAGDGGEVKVGDEQTKGGNVVTDPALKEQLTGASNGAGGAPASNSDGPSITQ